MTDTTKPGVQKKDERPFYRKKRVLIPVAILFLGIVGSQMEEDNRTDKNSSTPAAAVQDKSSHASSAEMDLKTKLRNYIKSIEDGDDLTKSELTSATAFQITAALYKAYAIAMNEGKASSDKEVLNLTAELERKIITSQQKNFPKIRKAYGEFLKNKLWEEDIYVELDGPGYSVVKFTGGYFAANKNIKETQETLSEMLQLLRFRQTQYRWYRGQDEFTYYTIASNKDSEIVE